MWWTFILSVGALFQPTDAPVCVLSWGGGGQHIATVYYYLWYFINQDRDIPFFLSVSECRIIHRVNMLSLMTSMVMEVKCCAVCAFNSRILLQHLSSLYDLKEQTILKLSLTELNEISSLTAYTYRLHKQSSTSALPLGIVHPYTKAEKKERVIPLLFYFSVTMFSVLELFIFPPCKWVN